MARIRTIKPEFPQSESMGKVSREARLCFILLWTLADDAGRLRGNPKMLASLLFPYDDDAKRLIEKWLGELEGASCIQRYEIGGNFFVQIVSWLEHQKIEKPSASKIPPPPEVKEGSGIIANVLESYPPDQGRDQGKDQGRDQGSSAEDEASPPLLSIPLVGDSEFGITEPMVKEWSRAYPGVDVLQQLRQMRVWAQANPTKRKTHRGLASFVVRWLTKAQDQAGAIPNLRAAPAEPAWRTEQRQRTQQAAPGVAVQDASEYFLDMEPSDVTSRTVGGSNLRQVDAGLRASLPAPLD